MRAKRQQTVPTRVKVGIFTGGVKENKPQLELNMGDLLRGMNYQESDGQYNGYRSLSGYEVYDGTALASTVYAPTSIVDGVVVYDPTAREARRASITPVGGSGASGSVRACFQDPAGVLAVRNDSTDTSGKVWKTTDVGWVEIPRGPIITYTNGNKNTGTKIKAGQVITTPEGTGVVTAINTESGSWDDGTATGYLTVTVTTGSFTSGVMTGSLAGTASYTSPPVVMNKSGSYKFIQGVFDLFPGLQRKKVTFFSSSTNYPSYITGDKIVPILDHNLPDNAANNYFATSIAEFKNRLWLGYPDGRLVFSNVGSPLDFDPSTFSGMIDIGDEIVDLKVSTGDVLVVMCKSSIQIIKALGVGDASTSSTTDYLFSNVTLAADIGCKENSTQRIFDDLVYIDKKGLTSLEATQKFGDFETKIFSKSIQKTLSLNLPNLVGSWVDGTANQYRVFFSDGFGIIFTFNMKVSGSSSYKNIKGATTFKYLTNISCVGDGIFGSTDGFLYKIDSGTSFNGENIDTRLVTSFHHYDQPTVFKRFREVYFEGQIPFYLNFEIKGVFDNRDTSSISSTSVDELIVSGRLGDVYGVGRYDVMRYSNSDSQTSVYYVSSYGTSMSITLGTSNKYAEPHTLSSMIVQYSINGRRM